MIYGQTKFTKSDFADLSHEQSFRRMVEENLSCRVEDDAPEVDLVKTLNKILNGSYHTEPIAAEISKLPGVKDNFSFISLGANFNYNILYEHSLKELTKLLKFIKTPGPSTHVLIMSSNDYGHYTVIIAEKDASNYVKFIGADSYHENADTRIKDYCDKFLKPKFVQNCDDAWWIEAFKGSIESVERDSLKINESFDIPKNEDRIYFTGDEKGICYKESLQAKVDMFVNILDFLENVKELELSFDQDLFNKALSQVEKLVRAFLKLEDYNDHTQELDDCVKTINSLKTKKL